MLLVFDTLRSDFRTLCARRGVPLPGFGRLAELASVPLRARCGSFPTMPMRTDLLTGRLSFLGGRWATPAADEPTFLSACARSGVRSCLVTDNYVIAAPQLNGVLPRYFDHVSFLRGYGSDPWAVPSAGEIQAARERARLRPCRNPAFEAQFVANARCWATEGGAPYERVFAVAADWLAALSTHPRFLLWVDAFGIHEPWVRAETAADPAELEATVVVPPYGLRGVVSQAQLDSLMRAYALRIGEMDRALKPLLDGLTEAMRGGDVALVTLSDHGFLFGEFGAVGKPPEVALPPQLHALECRVSVNLSGPFGSAGRAVQPHDVHHLCSGALSGGREIPLRDVHVLGRNTPRSNHLTVATDDGMGFLRKTGDRCVSEAWIPWPALDPRLRLEEHPEREIDTGVLRSLRHGLGVPHSPWITPFVDYLEKRTA
ncbi:MAG TPA: sulfatase-like hydrolase/transferase [Longimicrobium sp.]|nr:sulfatase-like hydrolase/transferase [Longimicrobium sp.]